MCEWGRGRRRGGESQRDSLLRMVPPYEIFLRSSVNFTLKILLCGPSPIQVLNDDMGLVVAILDNKALDLYSLKPR